ncbi:MAG: hypothetical protein ACI4JJ_04975 [Huintestinicola sp.]
MNKFSAFLAEHARGIVIGAIAVVSVVFIIVVYSIICSGNTDRKIVIDEITGSAFILKGDGQVNATRKTKLESGDVLITSADSTVILSADGDKKIYLEPETTLYIYYTERAGRGSIVVNLTEGAATCRLDSKLKSGEAFEVRTPNSVVSAQGTVFRTEFNFAESFMGMENVMTTDVQAIENNVTIQLYDSGSQPSGDLMLLTERKSARLVTCDESAQYNFLNQDTDISGFGKTALESLIRIAAEKQTAYSLTELNAAYQIVLGSRGEETVSVQTIYPAETETSSKTTTASTSVTSEETTTAEQTVTTAVTTEETELSVTSPTTVIKTVTGTTAAETTASTTQTTAIPPIQHITETVSAETTTAETTAPSEETTSEETSQTTESTTKPWWEIINSAALEQ